MQGGQVVAYATKIDRLRKSRGLWATLRFLAGRVLRHEVHIVYEANSELPLPTAQWPEEENLLQIGPENIDDDLNTRLLAFLGGDLAFENLEGVRKGDRLFVIAQGDKYLHRGYIMFETRTNKLLGDRDSSPIIGYCWTAPEARKRGLYRRALIAEVSYLWSKGYKRVLIETDPENRASQVGIESAGFRFAWEAHLWILLNGIVLRRVRDRSGSRWALCSV